MRTHGMSHTPEYEVWKSMKQRCHNPRAKDFPDYGKRGIAVCAKWRTNFAAFIADMGPRPGPRHMIERVNNDAGYCPENCTWALPAVQASNRRTENFARGPRHFRNKLTASLVGQVAELFSRGVCESEIARRVGVSAQIVSRVTHGEYWADVSGLPLTPRGQYRKLTVEHREQIRRDYAAGGVSQSAIAARYGVTQGAIGKVIRGR